MPGFECLADFFARHNQTILAHYCYSCYLLFQLVLSIGRVSLLCGGGPLVLSGLASVSWAPHACTPNSFRSRTAVRYNYRFRSIAGVS